MPLPEPIETPHIHLIPAWGLRIIQAINTLIGYLKARQDEIDNNRQAIIDLTQRFEVIEEFDRAGPVQKLQFEIEKIRRQVNRQSIAITELQSDVAGLKDLDRPRIVFKLGQPVDKPLPAHIEFNVGAPVDRPT